MAVEPEPDADRTRGTRSGPDGDGGATSTANPFGRVSRRAGTVFRYLLLAATLAGIAALAVLLGFVALDAVQPGTADAAWYGALVGLVVAPTLAVGGWLYRAGPGRIRSGLELLGATAVGLLYAGGATVVLLTLFTTKGWAALAVALVVPAAALVALRAAIRRGLIPDISTLALALAVGLVGVVSVTTIPPAILSLPVLPADWLLALVTVAVPAAVLAAVAVSRVVERRRPGVLTGVAVLAGTGVATAVALATGAGPTGPVTLVSLGLVPVAGIAAIKGARRRRELTALALPGVLLGGLVALRLVEVYTGVVGPEAWIDYQFLVSTAATPPESAGLYPAIVGTILLMVAVVVFSFPVGVGAAVYLEEYAADSTFTRIIEVNISNLAGVPSVVYGLLGLGAFVRFGGLSPGTVVVGGLTLALLILPIVIISSREAIRSVPDSHREASYGMGGTRWQTVKNVVLPEAFPGILTGTILALGRAVGETAPLIIIGAPSIFGVPTSLTDRVGALPLQVYAWASTFAGEAYYTTVLAAGVVTILVVLLTMNSVAIVLRNRYQRDA